MVERVDIIPELITLYLPYTQSVQSVQRYTGEMVPVDLPRDGRWLPDEDGMDLERADRVT